MSSLKIHNCLNYMWPWSRAYWVHPNATKGVAGGLGRPYNAPVGQLGIGGFARSFQQAGGLPLSARGRCGRGSRWGFHSGGGARRQAAGDLDDGMRPRKPRLNRGDTIAQRLPLHGKGSSVGGEGG